MVGPETLKEVGGSVLEPGTNQERRGLVAIPGLQDLRVGGHGVRQVPTAEWLILPVCARQKARQHADHGGQCPGRGCDRILEAYATLCQGGQVRHAKRLWILGIRFEGRKGIGTQRVDHDDDQIRRLGRAFHVGEDPTLAVVGLPGLFLGRLAVATRREQEQHEDTERKA